MGKGKSSAKYFAHRVKEGMIPATYDEEGNELTPEIVPDEATIAIEISDEDMKTHPWRLPYYRQRRLEVLRGERNRKLREKDLEYIQADEGRHPQGKTKENIGDEKQALRDMPISAEAALEDMINTDDIDEYLPTELEE